MSTYQHKQIGYLDWILLGVFAALLVMALLMHATPFGFYVALFAAGVMLVMALSFGWMEVRDEGQHLTIRYGPLRLFRKQLNYTDIRTVRQGRSSWIDGWGIHCLPGRGWTYNLWGFDCVEMTVGKTPVRVGTDDAANLAAFLQSKLDDHV